MSSCTDLLRLNEKGLFKDIKVSLSSGAKETRNILEIRDNVLYVWNADRCCVLTLNVAATRGKLGEDIPYQVRECAVVCAYFTPANRSSEESFSIGCR
ncbi:Uncharacterized protein DBV15_00625 [Temnothorax longispinosus]|uniref:Uncharacterized protein n=1 Tax=Temnothorax longispinosus TaxID=300112 RepID=A0A4S2KSM1_9HYME|nr:Uncharacterized protein DBV15_00625 [Temnothorax longispinosus]